MPRRWIAFVAVVFLAGPTALAEEPSLAESLLAILYSEGMIDDEKYFQLQKQARAEKKTLHDVAAGDPDRIRAHWKNGIVLEAPQRGFRLQLGGRLLIDGAMYDNDKDIKAALGTSDRFESGTEFRAARMYVEGQVAPNVAFKAEYDFAGGDADFKDVYIEFKKLPLVNRLRIGHFKEPLSLEEQTSARFTTFMERALPNALVPARNTGFMVKGTALDDAFAWAIGAFRDTDDFGNGFGESEYNVTARVTGTPYYADEGAKLLHLGFGYSHQFRSADLISFESTPESHITPIDYVGTGDFPTDGVDIFNPEMALVYGPASLQGEYVLSQVDVASTANLYGFYVQGSYFLTGEHRNYVRSSGRFDRIRPESDFTPSGGMGAWELAARWSQLDLVDHTVSGGELKDFTAGINWYLNPFTRIMFNYVLADLDNVGKTSVWQTRVQVDF